MYKVMVNTLLVDKGKIIIRKHEATSDAQKAFAECCTFATSSTTGMLALDTITTFLASHKLDPERTILAYAGEGGDEHTLPPTLVDVLDVLRETDIDDDHQLTSTTYPVLRRVNGHLETVDVPALNAALDAEGVRPDPGSALTVPRRGGM